MWRRARRASRRKALPRRWRPREPRSEDRLAGVLIMRVARLDLLRDRMHVAKAPLEGIFCKHRGRARHVIGGIDHGGRLMNGPGRGDADRDTMGFGDLLAAFEIAPD